MSTFGICTLAKYGILPGLFIVEFGCRLVLRIRADDPTAICQLGVKYGCSVPVGKELLLLAMALDLQVVGVR